MSKYRMLTLKTWMGNLGGGIHDKSENGLRIGVARVLITSATYSISDKTFLGFAAEVAKGTVTGQPAGVNKLRETGGDEVQSWRTSH
ncbi:hypothetical protein F5Y13DRAFT_76386 [Hypoxylon sp. FL1857]|nr:hypothetical protein F5Y13DRAFT_76386 [Hypoxylon sp. FL1857]